MAKQKDSWPEYECASLKIQNEARKAVFERAKRMAKELKTDQVIGEEIEIEEIEEAAAEKETD